MSYIFFIICFFLNAQSSDNIAMQRPEPQKILKIIEPINMSEEQKNKIYKKLTKNLKDFDSEKKKYDKKVEEKQKIEKEIEELKLRMIEINKKVTFIIKSNLNEEQLKIFEDILKKQKEKVSKPKSSQVTEEEDKKEEKKYIEKESPFDIYFP